MRLILIIVVIVLSTWWIYQTKQHPQLKFNSISDRLLHPLDTRLRYRVADVDPRFGLSQQQVIQLSQEAAEIWHKGTLKPLFIYDSNAQLAIHLIYDDRQEQYNAYKQVQKTLAADKARNDLYAENLANSRKGLEMNEQQLRSKQAMIRAEIAQLSQERMNWSRIEHAQGPNMQRVERELEQVKAQAMQLDQEIDRFNQQNDQFNQQVLSYNQQIDQYNAGVIQASQRFPAREFHKGVFMGDQIQIYQFDAEDDLRLTLAHELGHALGLSHHNDPAALMYPILGAQQLENFKLMPADQGLLYYR
ncbi:MULTISPECIES: matrixin family metalloprotease [unclassified Acinetobacter]|uniref:matrixin family metalloprotease n=1 Tax=unclassified Acinetobacter TaxID=196816 RepID=UPI0015D1D4AF|nr:MULTISPECIES: matrixin family metalloprotease [unclassified Acinetobacter]UUS65214.1 matrixin family metalloprotease [Acinetobacter sp. YH12068_T]